MNLYLQMVLLFLLASGGASLVLIYLAKRNIVTDPCPNWMMILTYVMVVPLIVFYPNRFIAALLGWFTMLCLNERLSLFAHYRKK